MLIGAPDPEGRCEVRVFARGGDESLGGGWVRHASAVMRAAEDAPADVGQDLAVWPPPGAVAMAGESLDQRLAEAGLGYGPAFQGVRALWRRGEELFAEVTLEQGQHGHGFGLHPVLPWSAALHAAVQLPGRPAAPACAGG